MGCPGRASLVLVLGLSSPLLAQNGQIEGTVTVSGPGEGGAGVENVSIEALDGATGGFVASTTPDGAGFYSLSVPPGRYVVHAQTHATGFVREFWAPGVNPNVDFFDQAGRIDVASGATVSDSDFTLELGNRITGHVFLDVNDNRVEDMGEGPIVNAWVNANLAGPCCVGNGASTASSGNYRIVGLRPGRYFVQVQPSSPAQPFVEERYNNKTFLNDQQDTVDVTSGDAVANFDPIPGEVISGLVFQDLNRNGVRDGDPIEPVLAGNGTIRAFHAATSRCCTHAPIGSDGIYALAVPPGTYRVEAQAYSGNLLREFWQNVFFYEAATNVTSPQSGIDFSLEDGAVYGTLQGIVTDAVGAAILGVNVRVQTFSMGWDVAGGRADAGGMFVIGNLPPGDYKVLFDTQGSNTSNNQDFVSEYWNECQATPAACQQFVIDPNDFKVVFPTSGGKDVGSFKLTQGGGIEGRVCVNDEDGPCPASDPDLPLPFRVQAQSFVSGGPFQPFLPGAEVNTNGSYRLRGLPAPEAYKVQAATWGTDYVPVYFVTASDSTFSNNLATSVQVNPGATVPNVDLHLFRGGSISGRVTCASGPAVPNYRISVGLVSQPGGFWAGTQTDANGNYIVRGLPTGQYQVRADRRGGGTGDGCDNLANETYPSFVSVIEGQDTPNIDFVLDPAGSIRGTVTQLVAGVSQPVVNLRVSAVDFDTNEFFSDGNTDTLGNYEIGALPRGRRYRVQVETRDSHLDPQFFNFIQVYYDNAVFRSDADPVPATGTLGAAQETGIDFQLQLGGAISGRVVDDSTGLPISGANAFASDFDVGGGFGHNDQADQNGFYIIRGLPPARYRVGANASPRNYVGEYYDDKVDFSGATPVTVPATSDAVPIPVVSGIDFALAPGAVVKGRVTSSGGSPLAGLTVGVEQQDSPFLFLLDTTDANGEYELAGLVAGRYRLRVYTIGTPYAFQRRDVVLSGSGRPCLDTMGRADCEDFSLAAGATLQVRAFEDANLNGSYDNGEGRAGLNVRMSDFFTGEGVSVDDTFVGQTGTDGLLTVSGLAAGSYRVQVDGGGFVTMFYDNQVRSQDANALVVPGVSSADFSLIPGREVRGHVFADSNSNGVQDGTEPSLAGIRVTIEASDGSFNRPTRGDPTRTDANGDYVISGVLHSFAGSPIAYRASASARATPYASEFYKRDPVTSLPVGTFKRSLADVLVLSAGNATGVDFSLVFGGTISGTVTEEGTGSPIPDVRVNARAFDGDGFGLGDTTDSEGRYLIDGLPPGSPPDGYRVDAFDNQGVFVYELYDNALFSSDADPVTVNARSSESDPLATTVDFALARGGAIEGIVYHDHNGNGTMDGLEPPVANAFINVSEFVSPNRCCLGSGNRSSGIDGRFRVGGLPPGMALRLQANPPSDTDLIRVFYDGTANGDTGTMDSASAASVTVSAGGSVPINFALTEGGSIAGVVYHDLNGNGQRDEASPGVLEPAVVNANLTVSEFAAPNRCCFGRNNSTGIDGSFRVRGVPPGSYRVQVNPPSSADFIRVFYDGAANGDTGTMNSANAAAVPVTGGAITAGINFAVTLGGSISGFVKDGNGTPLRNFCCVNANPITPGLLGAGTGTDGSGNYIIRGLAPGVYRVNAGGGGFPQEYWNNQFDATAATPVTVGTGTTTDIDFYLAGRPTLLAGPSPATGAQGAAGMTVTVTASGLAGDSCSITAPPCSRVELGGYGITVTSQSLSGGVFTLTLDIAADAALGVRSLSIVSDFLQEDAALVVNNAFEVTPDALPPTGGQRLYVSNGDLSQIRVYNTADASLVGSPFEVCCDPGSIALDGRLAYVGGGDRTLAIVDMELGQEVFRTGGSAPFGPFGPNGVAATAKYVYTVNREFGLNNRVQVFDAQTWLPAILPGGKSHIVVGALGTNPFGLRIDPQQRWLYAANQNAVAPNTASVAVIDIDPLSPTFHTVIATVYFPTGFSPRGIAFTPDMDGPGVGLEAGARAYVVGQRDTYLLDTAKVVQGQPPFIDVDGNSSTGVAIGSQTGISPLPTRGGGNGIIEIAPLPGSSTFFAYIVDGGGVRIVDVSTNPDRPEIVRTFGAGFFNSNGFKATADGSLVFMSFNDSKDLYVLDLRGMTYDTATRRFGSPTLSLTRFDRDQGPQPGKPLFPQGMALADPPTPAAGPRPTVDSVSVEGGAPAVNGSDITINLTGQNFRVDLAKNQPIVWLAGTLVRGTVIDGTATTLRVRLPATTPTGQHRVVVTNVKATGNESCSPCAATLQVVSPAFPRTQNAYVSNFGKDSITIYEPAGTTGTIETQPAPGGIALTPDGVGGVVSHFYSSVLPSRELCFPAKEFEVSTFDLDPASATFRQTVADIPYVYGPFESPAVTPNKGDPDGVFVYVPNRFISDTVSMIDPAAGVEVDVDNDPGTQTYPPQDNFTCELGTLLPGLSRLPAEIGGQPTDLNLQPADAALTPDGDFLYTANLGLVTGTPTRPAQAAGVGIINVLTRQVLAKLTADGTPADGGPRSVNSIAVSPDNQRVYALGLDSTLGPDGLASPFLYAYRVGVTDDTAFEFRIPLPEDPLPGETTRFTELPRGITITPDGGTIYTVARTRGELYAIDVATRSLTRIPLVPGLTQHALSASDNLLYVTNGFRADVLVLDVTNRLSPVLRTNLGAGPCPVDVALQPTTIAPRVTGVSPTSGPVEGNIPVTITGNNFKKHPNDPTKRSRVFFNGVEATGVNVVSTLRIDATLPPGANGLADITVLNPDGQSGTLVGRFRYQADPNPPVFTSQPHKVDGSEVFSSDFQTVSLVIEWTTDEPSTSRVDYGPTAALGSSVTDPTLTLLHQVTLSGLAPSTTYQFRATSVDGAAPPNSASNPVSPGTLTFMTPAQPDRTAPVITSGPSVSATQESAVVQWQTDESSKSVVEFDATVNGSVPSPGVPGPDGTAHTVTLTGLAADTIHEYRARSKDASNNEVVSSIRTFRTDPLPDAFPPVIVPGPPPNTTPGPFVSYLSNNLVIVTWQTDEPSTSFVNYGVSSINEQGVIDVSLVTTHTVFLTNLLPNTAYGFQVGSTDPSGNTVLSADPFAGAQALGVFRLTEDVRAGVATLSAGTTLATTAAATGFTTPPAPDTTPPVLTSPVTVTALSFDRVLITAGTDEAASIRADFGVGALTNSAFDPSFTQSPSLLLVNLTGERMYQLRVTLTDPKGNATAVDTTFTTPAAPDTTPPTIASLAVGSVTETSAVVSWLTEEPADSLVRFGPQGAALDRQAGLLGLRTSHSVLITGLEPGTTYESQVSSTDGSGNTQIASPPAFRTAFVPPVIDRLTPDRGAQGATLDVNIGGSRFDPNVQVDFGADISVNSRTVNATGTQITANVAISSTATVGRRTVSVTNPRSGLSATASFTALDQTLPIITIAEPASGAELLTPSVLVRGSVSEPAAVTVNGAPASVNGTDFQATVTLAAPGINSIVVTATDLSGNVASTAIDVKYMTLSIADHIVTEGSSGTTTAQFVVVLSAPSSQAVTVGFQTADGTAISPGDYTATSGTLSFEPGSIAEPITVPVNADVTPETAETFVVNLAGASGATIIDNQAQGTILNDDGGISVNDIAVTEVNAGNVMAVFTVSLSAPSAERVTVSYTTADGSATAPSDYQAKSGTLTFQPGTLTQTVAVPVNGDLAVEDDETFLLKLTGATNAVILDASGQGTILNDDTPPPTVSIADAVATTEGNTSGPMAHFIISLSAASAQMVTVQFTTENGTATAGSDYESKAGAVDFPPGTTAHTVGISVYGDRLFETDETFSVRLTSATGATIGDNLGTATILNDDPMPALSINDVSLNEGQTGKKTFVFTVALSNPSYQTITVSYTTANGTATAPSDYATKSGALTFAPGTTSQTIMIVVNGDKTKESTETFFVMLSNATNATIADDQGVGTILNDDGP